MRNYPVVTVSEKAEKSIRGGHPWVYSDEVREVCGTYAPGDIVDVKSGKGKYLGSGYINDSSKIRVRIISKNPNDRFDRAFYERRVRYAIDYRRTVMGDDFSACRLIFGEADMLPGLTVDRFSNVLVTETLCLGTERVKDIIFSSLVNTLRQMGERIDAIYERNSSPIRALEGMESYDGYYSAPGLDLSEIPGGSVFITENGIKYRVDFVNGQKTGFFLDQKYNRQAVAKISRGRRVLDCFTHTGSFGLNVAAGGAASVLSVDISDAALDVARENCALNGFSDRIEYRAADVFDLLSEYEREGKRDFDLIILDPPAFTKSRATLKNAIKGYREINYRAMKFLPRGGYLATCSCSHFMTDTYFKQMLHNAAEDAGVSLRQIEARTQSPDHPILWNVPETDYLKFYIFQIV